MTFLRIKRIRGRDYAYLVESRWDPERRTSRQTTIKYIGPADQIRMEDIPPEYRDERTKSFVLRHSAKAEDQRQRTVSAFRRRLLQALTEGDRVGTSLVAEQARAALGLDAFYVEILPPAMHEIGERWNAGELTVSMEHLASNITAELVETLNARIRVGRKPRGTAVLCTPQGEMHHLSAKVLEGLLLERGFRPWNIVASAPTDSIADFVAAKEPDLVLVSLTIPQYLPALKRLLRAFQGRGIPSRVLVGGQGVRGLSPKDVPRSVTVVPDDALEALDRACGVRH